MITYWHTRRAITRIGNLINTQAIMRTPMNVRKHYFSGFTRARIFERAGSIYHVQFSNKSEIAMIWERGYKSYDYGKRVLGNSALERIRQGVNGKYIRLPVGRGSNKVWRTLSESKMKRSWIMPKLNPTNAYGKAYKANKKTINKYLSEAIGKDIVNELKRRLQNAL